MPLPFASIRDLARQCRQCHDQMLAKRQSSPLDGEQRKRARMPPQPDPHDASDGECAWAGQCESQDRGRLTTRSECRQQEPNRVHSKSRARSKSRKRSESRRRSKSWKCSKSKKRSKSRRREEGRERDKHKPRRPGVWPSLCQREVPDQPPAMLHREMDGAPSIRHLQTTCQSSSN